MLKFFLLLWVFDLRRAGNFVGMRVTNDRNVRRALEDLRLADSESEIIPQP
jgi:hypothetical protein